MLSLSPERDPGAAFLSKLPSDVFRPGANANADAPDALFATLYEELRQIAYREMRRNAGLTISATTLIHEAYISMQRGSEKAFNDHAHFLAYSSRAMRSLIIDFARRRRAQRRGGGFEITSHPTVVPEQVVEATELERLGVAIDTLEALDPKLAELVNLKFFCGFSFAEISAMSGVSERTVQRDWAKARILLLRALEGRDLLSD
jgi:RNA polymerase sigma factor (TIGR02999 family)